MFSKMYHGVSGMALKGLQVRGFECLDDFLSLDARHSCWAMQNNQGGTLGGGGGRRRFSRLLQLHDEMPAAR